MASPPPVDDSSDDLDDGQEHTTDTDPTPATFPDGVENDASARPTIPDGDGDGLLGARAEQVAFLLGVGAGFSAGYTDTWEAALALMAVALGTRAAPGPLKHVRREPLYAALAISVGYTLGLLAQYAALHLGA